MDVTVNGEPRAILAAWQEDTLPLVLREAFGLTGARFGCGQSLCGGGVPRLGRRRIGRDRLCLRLRRPAALHSHLTAATRALRRPPIGWRPPRAEPRVPDRSGTPGHTGQRT